MWCDAKIVNTTTTMDCAEDLIRRYGNIWLLQPTIAVTEKGKMARYIDADAFKKSIDDWATQEKYNWSMDYDIIFDFLREFQTADVRENVKGKWMLDHNSSSYCSSCGEHTFTQEGGFALETDFCPNCGSDMRKA